MKRSKYRLFPCSCMIEDARIMLGILPSMYGILLIANLPY